MNGRSLLEIERLTAEYAVRTGLLRKRKVYAVDRADLSLVNGEIVGLVGESGCGKSTLARAVVGLVRPTEGRVLLNGKALPLRRSPVERGQIQMIFQNPGASLDPRRTVLDTVAESLRRLPASAEGGIERRAVELLEMVGLGAGQLRLMPRELSGGQRQRVAIARALAVRPRVLVADEAVAALDASVAGAILTLLSDLRDQLGLAVLFISHDLAAVRGLCDRVAVMYLGTIVEEGPASEVFARPGHPYTRALLDASPSLRHRRLEKVGLRGEPPSPLEIPGGCRFHPRCTRAEAVCGEAVPEEQRQDAHGARCHFAWR